LAHGLLIAWAMGDNPKTFRHLGGGQKGLFLLLRYVFIIAASYLLIFEAPVRSFGAAQALMIAAALASNVVLSLVRPQVMFAWYVEAPVLVADTLWVSWALHSTGTMGQEFFLLYFFVLFLAALGENMLMVLLGSTVVSAANVYFIADAPFWTSPHLLRIVFFYAVALFYGNVLTQIKRERQRADKGFAWAKSLEEKVAERTQELHRLYGEAQVASRLKSDFIATMSHELRTPLNVIMGYTDLLLVGEFGDLSTDQTNILRVITKYQRDLLELINTTLDLNRLETGKVALELSRCDLSELLRLLDDETRRGWAKPSIQFIWNISPDLPQLYTDPTKLKTVLKNLIGNAIKFTEHGSVTIDARPNDGGVEISVADTGIGIPKDQQALIFEPFRQADSSITGCHGGVGLGLYIARRLVGMMGGQISVESEVLRGSTFRCWLPVETRPTGVQGNRTNHRADQSAPE
jgi:signal transduction histidine kinase